MTTSPSQLGFLGIDALLQERQSNNNILNYKSKEFDGGLSNCGDSSLKRNSSFAKKLKNISREQLSSLISEVEALKSTKFIEEITISILENRWKKSQDIRATVIVRTYFLFFSYALTSIESIRDFLINYGKVYNKLFKSPTRQSI